jgi:hypothetical protein
MTYETFCGGIFETNCYLIRASEGWILFGRASMALGDWLDSRQLDLKLLLLTHAIIDHVRTANQTPLQLPGRLPSHYRPDDFRSNSFAVSGLSWKSNRSSPISIEETPSQKFSRPEMEG